jgi:DNA (cytosine-5)-methyltransferase 1
MNQPGLVLSLFPGIGLLDRAFELERICVVRGPDLLWGGDIRCFDPPADSFWGIIAGSPCQDFSGLRRDEPTGLGVEMLEEFRRIVSAVRPAWWLLENVPRAPDVLIPGYYYHRIDVDQAWYQPVSRLRHIQFGSRSGQCPNIVRGSHVSESREPAALASDRRSFDDMKRLQGLPEDFELPGFTSQAKVRAVGNGVPIMMGRVLARAILEAYGLLDDRPPLAWEWYEPRRCSCGCGRELLGKAKYDSPACRKRSQRRRDASSRRPNR